MYARRRPNRRLTIAPLACAGLALVAASRPALGAGETPDGPPPAPITVVDPAAAPFSSGELAQALLARLLPAEEASPPEVRIAPAGDDAVTVQVGDRSRRVTLGDRTGPAAARVVALVIAELMSGAGESEPAAAGTAPEPPVVTTSRPANRSPSASLAASPSPAPSGPAPPPRLYVTGGVARGISAEELLAATIDADIVLSIGDGGLRLAPSAGLVYMPTRNAGSWNEVSYSAAVVRLLLGRDWSPFDLFAGPFVAPYTIKGATEDAGVLFGAEAVARLAAPLSPSTRLVVATRAHAYANRVRVNWPDGGAYATPRVELTIGAGLAWDWAP